MTYALETKTVTKIYKTDKGETRAVDGVSMSVANGEFVALVGPSGSGKTTLLAMLATLLKPSEGEIVIDGQALQQMSDKDRTRFRREKIGFTFQANNLVPYLTALENVELMLQLNGKGNHAGRERAKELLARLGLGDRFNNLPRQLSGGQQQRVAIARALIHNPGARAGGRTDGESGHRTRAPGRPDLCESDSRAKTRGDHGHARLAHDRVCGSRDSDDGWHQCGVSSTTATKSRRLQAVGLRWHNPRETKTN